MPTYTTIDFERARELDHQFRKDVRDLITAYLGDGLAESYIVETLQDEIASLNNFD